MNSGSRSAHAHPLFPIAAQRSKSNGAPRAAIVALTIDVPPTSRPRGTRKLRPRNVPAPSVLAKSQSNSGIPPAHAPMVLAADGEQRRHRLLLWEIGPRLEQQDAAGGVFGETRRDDAAARSRADDNDVELVHGRSSKRARRRGRRLFAFLSGARPRPVALQALT